MTRVRIDLNVRVRGSQTFTRVTNADGPLVEGEAVEVYEAESEVYGPATVTEVDRTKGLVYLAVEWAKLREAVITPEQLTNFVAGVAAARQALGAPGVADHFVRAADPARQLTLEVAPNLDRFLAPTVSENYVGSAEPVYRPHAYTSDVSVPSHA